MGFKTEFNWVLKLKPEQGLDEENLRENEIYEFMKEEYRVYQVNIPIDLINNDWEAVGRVVITEFTNKEGKTFGKYKVMKIYNKEEKELITKYWSKS